MLSRRVAKIIKTRVSPFLLGLGFERLGTIYYVVCADVEWLIEIQRGKWSGNGVVDFTINYGVYVPGIVGWYSGADESGGPKSNLCCILKRVEFPAIQGADRWWSVATEDVDPEDVDGGIGDEIIDQIENVIMPFLEQMRSLDDVARALVDDAWAAMKYASPRSRAIRLVYAGLIYHKMGHTTRAIEVMNRGIEIGGNGPAGVYIRKARERVASADQ